MADKHGGFGAAPWVPDPAHRILELRRRFDCAGCSAWVTLDAIRSDTGEPRFSVCWVPKPARLTAGDMAHFDRMRAQAQAELLAELEALRC
jgi:hypothetical protein